MTHSSQHAPAAPGAPTEAPDLSVIIVNWNTLELTTEAIESIRAHTSGIRYEIILIDNGSRHDASASELPRRFPDVVFVANAENLGFAGANNIGFSRARGRYVLLLNSDTLQLEDALTASVRYMDAHPEVGGLGILHRNHDAELTVQPSFASAPRAGRDILALLGVGEPDRPPDPQMVPPEQDVDWLVGSFLLVRRSCLDDVGGLDERFFLYEEDIDWCLRARKRGWRLRFWPGAHFIHLGNGSRQFMRDKTFSHFRSHYTFVAKHHSRPAAWAYYLLLNGRLAAATLWQIAQLAVGRGSSEAVRERLRRQRDFLTLAAGRRGS